MSLRQHRGAILLSILVFGGAASVACYSSGSDDPPAANAPPSGSPPGATPAPSSTGPSAPGQPPGPGPVADGGAEGGGPPDAAPDASASGPLSAAYQDFEINHVLSTGQSNSTSNGGDPPLTTTQPYTNVMFNTGVMSMKNCPGEWCSEYEKPTSLVPLVEGDRFFNYPVETSSAGIANEISLLAKESFGFGTRAGYPAKHDVLVTLHGRSGHTYWCLRKGGCDYKPAAQVKAFDQALMEVRDAKALATALGRSYVVRAVTTIHGESDHYSGAEFPMAGSDGTPNAVPTYADALLEWQRDYEKEVRAITGQAQNIPLLVSQISGWNDTRVSTVAQMQLDAHARSGGKVLLVAPGYAMSMRSDCRHFDNHGARQLGEYFAKVYAKVILGGQTWEPVRPQQATRAGNVITVKYHVPAPPLVLDTTRVTNPGNYGFDYVDDSGNAPAITNVEVAGGDTVKITLAAAPTGANGKLRYAQNQIPNTCIGPGTAFAGGARGNVRDSDATRSAHTDATGAPYPLFNWGVAFEVAVP